MALHMPQKIRHKILVIRIGTRGSLLALRQTHEVARLLKKACPSIRIEEVIIRTSGDKFQKKELSHYRTIALSHQYSGKGLFIKEIVEALQSNKIDMAVHSLKDVPALIPGNLQLTAFLKRADPSDLFISARYKNLETMPKGAVFGTSSPRRAAQVLARRPGLKIVPLRGNVETRIRKVEEGVCDATILAAAGINRLGLSVRLKHLNTQTLKHFIPAIGQGIICVESRKQDGELNKFLRRSLNHHQTERAAITERSFLQKIGGDCHTPIAGHSTISGKKIKLQALVASPDGMRLLKKSLIGADPVKVGSKLAEKFIELGARRIMGLEQKVLSTNLGGELPLITIKDPSDGFAGIDEAIKKIDTFDWLVFTSKNAVKKFFSRLSTADGRRPTIIKIAAIGPFTAEKFRSLGLKVNLMPESEHSSKGLAREFAKLPMKGVKVLFPRAKEGRETLVSELKKQGASVALVEAYQTVLANIDVKEWSQRFENDPPDVITFSSPSAISAYLSAFGKKYLKKRITKISCIGDTTKAFAIKRGLKAFLAYLEPTRRT